MDHCCTCCRLRSVSTRKTAVGKEQRCFQPSGLPPASQLVHYQRSARSRVC